MFNIDQMKLDQKRYEIALNAYLEGDMLRSKIFYHALKLGKTISKKNDNVGGVNLWDIEKQEYEYDDEELQENIDGFRDTYYVQHPDAWVFPVSLYVWESFKEAPRHADEMVAWILIQAGITDISIRYYSLQKSDKTWSLWLCLQSPKGCWKFKLQQNIRELPYNWSYPEVIIEVVGIANFVLDQYGKNCRAFRTDKHESEIDRISLIERESVSKLSRKNSQMFYKIPDNFRSRSVTPTFLN